MKCVKRLILLLVAALSGCKSVPQYTKINVEACHLCSYVKVNVEIQK